MGAVTSWCKGDCCWTAKFSSDYITEFGVNIALSLDEILSEVDAVNVLRIQFERQHGIALPSIEEYRNLYGLTRERQALLSSDALVLHPGPINRGVELDSEVADGQNNVILNQVDTGFTYVWPYCKC